MIIENAEMFFLLFLRVLNLKWIEKSFKWLKLIIGSITNVGNVFEVSIWILLWWTAFDVWPHYMKESLYFYNVNEQKLYEILKNHM